MRKSEVYSWRVSPDLKGALEQAAHEERRSLGALLDRIAAEWLETKRRGSSEDELARRRLQAAAARCFGTIRGGDTYRSEKVRARVRARLERRRAR
jgi:hypothetical protein